MTNFHTDNPMTVDMTTITEDQATDLYYRLARNFGWGGTFFTRADAEERWDTEEDGPFTDEVWEAIRLTWWWRKGLEQTLCEQGWELVAEAVAEVSRARATGKAD
jgi:hypothetical protein